MNVTKETLEKITPTNTDVKPIKFYTTKDLCILLNISFKYAQKLVRDGKIKAIKVGNEWRITEDHLNEYLKSYDNKPKNKD